MSGSRMLISTKSAGKGRTISIFYNPMNLRHELDFKGETKEFFPGTITFSRAQALARAQTLLVELRATDKTRSSQR